MWRLQQDEERRRPQDEVASTETQAYTL